MRPRKVKSKKEFEYHIPLWDTTDTWHALSLSDYCDQYDAAEEAAEFIYNNGDSDTQEAFSQGLPIVIREKGTDNIFGFELSVDYMPQFNVKERVI